jgi:hypothetical protein
LVGSREGNDTYVVSMFLHDDFGLSPTGPTAQWWQCTELTVLETCSTTDTSSCFECTPQTREQCSCTQPSEPSGEPVVECIDASACNGGSCLINDVCYPSGASTEDGCCTCDGGTASCIQPAWCPGWVQIGKRCAGDTDCGAPMSGLRCRTDFIGERGVCTRDCNYGCPTGTECLTVPDYNGGTIEDQCMRFCSTSDVCSQEVRGEPLGSECFRPADRRRSYCF